MTDDEQLYRLVNDGLALYSAGKWFEAHEVWEYAWNGEVGRTKLVLQALIQIAAALLKHESGVHAGTSKLLAKADEKIAEIRVGASSWLGIDLVQLSADVKKALAQADAIASGSASGPAAVAGRVEPPALPRVTGPDGILYLHGFASGPGSHKARMFVSAFAADGFSVAVPDQNEGDFRRFTVSRALALAKRNLRDRTVVVGSSLGGYLATLLAAADDRVKALVLMAPAFDFGGRMKARYGERALEEWRRSGAAEVDHYGLGGKQAIAFAVLEDALRYPSFPAIRVPTYLLHGSRDDTVPPAQSVQVAQSATDRVELDMVDDDHMLANTADRAIEATRRMIAGLGLRRDPRPVDPDEALSRPPPSEPTPAH